MPEETPILRSQCWWRRVGRDRCGRGTVEDVAIFHFSSREGPGSVGQTTAESMPAFHPAAIRSSGQTAKKHFGQRIRVERVERIEERGTGGSIRPWRQLCGGTNHSFHFPLTLSAVIRNPLYSVFRPVHPFHRPGRTRILAARCRPIRLTGSSVIVPRLTRCAHSDAAPPQSMQPYCLPVRLAP